MLATQPTTLLISGGGGGTSSCKTICVAPKGMVLYPFRLEIGTLCFGRHNFFDVMEV